MTSTPKNDLFTIEVIRFVCPHIIFMSTDNEATLEWHRQYISKKIAESKLVPIPGRCAPNQVVALAFNGGFVRARILEEIVLANGLILSVCWIMDDLILLKNIVKKYEIAEELIVLPCRYLQASLNNISYEKQMLSSIADNVTYPYILPPRGSIICGRKLLTNVDMLQFQMAELYDTILIGEVLIYREGKVFFLTHELVRRHLLSYDKERFIDLKHGLRNYFMHHVDSVTTDAYSRLMNYHNIPLCPKKKARIIDVTGQLKNEYLELQFSNSGVTLNLNCRYQDLRSEFLVTRQEDQWQGAEDEEDEAEEILPEGDDSEEEAEDQEEEAQEEEDDGEEEGDDEEEDEDEDEDEEDQDEEEEDEDEEDEEEENQVEANGIETIEIDDDDEEMEVIVIDDD
ncbi:uncharacterized protein LOC126748289 [Anthonomus grandis grandis]|uniref:uncharacterized protein LOC126748289 n=1 Tax=Anthonomus grandis grandis TaxID=2921223 RepID=UPI002165F14B|nr:uncharacterized protein LOC126748289 [Anthonomus grandis grandis]